MGSIPNIQNLAPMTIAFCPVMDRRQFAQVVGLTVDTVEAMVARGYLPCIRIGKRSLINIALLQQRCIEQGFA
jgi:excisionase family DNA binding protein